MPLALAAAVRPVWTGSVGGARSLRAPRPPTQLTHGRIEASVVYKPLGKPTMILLLLLLLLLLLYSRADGLLQGNFITA